MYFNVSQGQLEIAVNERERERERERDLVFMLNRVVHDIHKYDTQQALTKG